MLKQIEKMNIPYGIQKDARARNIILFPDNLGNRHITFMSFYNICPGSSEENDRSSSVTLLLKLAEYINNEQNTRIVIVFIDGDISAGKGCEMYFAEDPYSSLVINLDDCGISDCISIAEKTSPKNVYAGFFRCAMTEDMLRSDDFSFCEGCCVEQMGLDILSIKFSKANNNLDKTEHVYEYIKEATDSILAIPDDGVWLGQKEINHLLEQDSIAIIRYIYS